MVSYFYNSLSLSLPKDINLSFLSLKVLTYPLTLDNIKTNGRITSSKYHIKYLELFLVSINFDMTIIFMFFLHRKILLFLLLSYQI